MQDGKKSDTSAPWHYAGASDNEMATSKPSKSPAPSTSQRNEDTEDKIMWTASEYLAHDKDMSWYAMLGGGAVLVAGLTFLITRDAISTSVIAVAGLTVGIFAARKPHVLTYELTEHGIRIGGKPYDYSLFKSFTVQQEGGVPSIELLPLKRFMTPLTIYFDPGDAEVILNVIAHFLPNEQREAALIDRMMHRLRF